MSNRSSTQQTFQCSLSLIFLADETSYIIIGVYVNIYSNGRAYVVLETDLRSNVIDLREAKLDRVATATVFYYSSCRKESLL